MEDDPLPEANGGGTVGPLSGRGILQKVQAGHFGHAEFENLQVTYLVLSSRQLKIYRALECKDTVSAGGTDSGLVNTTGLTETTSR